MRKFHVFVAISLLLHIGLFAVLLLPDFSSDAKPVPVVYEVDIVPGPPGAAFSGSNLRNFSAPASVPRNVADFSEISKDMPADNGPSELPEPDLDSESSDSYETPRQGRQGSGDSSGGSAYGEVARNEAWAGIVMARFKQVWQIPEGVPIKPNLQATFSIRISRSGDVTDKRLIVSSGNRPYDRSVEIALSRIKLPPPPGGKDVWTLTFIPPHGN